MIDRARMHIRTGRARHCRWLGMFCLAMLAALPAAALEFEDLAARLGVEAPEFLPVDEAFAFDTMHDGERITAFWSIAPEYYLYRRQLDFSSDTAGVELEVVALPEGEQKEDEYFGVSEVYHDNLNVELALYAAAAPSGPVGIIVRYQGCAEAGLCYPPELRTVEVPARSVQVRAGATPAAGAAPAGADALAGGGELASGLAGGSLFWTLSLFFLAGIGLAFTPCVLPMVPILSSIIVGQGERVTVARSASLSAAYVLGMAITYACIGVLMGLFGASMNLQAQFQSPWVVGATAALFVAFSGSMFGFYELQIPAFLRDRLDRLGQRQQGGHLGGVVAMGAISSLVVSPCVTAPLASALIYISATGDAVIGGLALLLLGLGMGVPLMVVGIGGGELLPRAGGWMNSVKAAFGVLMLGMAIWLLDRVLPAPAVLALWAALAIAVGVWLGALEAGRDVLPRAAGVVALTWGVLLLIGSAAGGDDPLRPLERFGTGMLAATAGGAPAQSTGPDYLPVADLPQLQARLATAADAGRPVMLDFYADWCVACRIMEDHVFPEPGVMQRLQGFDVLRADVTANGPAHRALLEHFGLFGPPAMLFFDSSGQELRSHRLQGELGATAFAAHLDTIEQASAGDELTASVPAR